ncbi:MAG: ferrous iron transport protein B [Candidatus Cloacimonetes bacterium]|nr:ferrous iron transport protein B [Candidatus Cloacimonadota bacterium]
MSKNSLTIALTGNPNCGKTTIFNALTGSQQTVGNWAGVTVEHKEGLFTHKGVAVTVIDLPGTYSFSALSDDEQIANSFVQSRKADLIVNIVDASNLERNLYLTTQLLEMKIPMLVVLNMMDVAKSNNIEIDVKHLARHLDCPVVEMVANRKNDGLDKLKDAVIQADTQAIPKTDVLYDEFFEKYILEVEEILKEKDVLENINLRWLAVKMFEDNNKYCPGHRMGRGQGNGNGQGHGWGRRGENKRRHFRFRRRLQQAVASDTLRYYLDEEFSAKLSELSLKVKKHTRDSIDVVIADGRYGFIRGLSMDVIKRSTLRRNITEVIDNVVLSRYLGIPSFFIVLFLVFFVTINVGTPFIDFLDSFTGAIFVDGFAHLLENLNAPLWLINILANSIGGGIQTVSTFIPPIFFIFVSLAILEDSGYMSRAAFVMDRFLRFLGLPGKAFISLIVGFGCTVPAILATRTLENKRERLIAIMMTPFMSCGARFPVYALFISIFFARYGTLVLFGLYMLGIILAIITGLLFKSTIFQGETSTFVMELPPYHIPTLRGIFTHTWFRLKAFVTKAGIMILVLVIIMSIFGNIGIDGKFGQNRQSDSLLSGFGRVITPIFHPIGIDKDNWEASVGLVTGLFAKEAVIGTLSVLYKEEISESNRAAGMIEEKEEFHFWSAIGGSFVTLWEGFFGSDTEEGESDNTLRPIMVSRFKNKINVLAYLIFILIYAPCVAAIGTIFNETNGKWTAIIVTYLTGLAWLISMLFYQTATFLSHPLSSGIWILSGLGVITIFYLMLKHLGKNLKGKLHYW